MDRKYGLAAAFGSVWMMRPTAFEQMCGLIPSLPAEFRIADYDERGLIWMAGGRSRQQKSVAVLGLYGMIDKRSSLLMDYMGGTSTDEFGAVFDQLVADPNVKGIVIDTDSPGGTATGTYELSKKIYDARGAKPIVSISNAEMNSAAYYVASAASAVFATPSSSTGSIGVWSAAMEFSKALEEEGVKVQVWRASESPNKAAFLPFQEFSKESIQREQQEVDRVYGEFRSSVARNRGLSETQVQKNFGQGDVMGSREALEAGMVDKIATLEEVVSRMYAGKITQTTLGNRDALEAAFAEPIEPDDWKHELNSRRVRSRLRVAGVLQGS